eukprot:751089-Hanusia_phi.AAC.4
MAISDGQLRKIYSRCQTIPTKSDAIKSVVTLDDAIQTLRELSKVSRVACEVTLRQGQVCKDARNRSKGVTDKDEDGSPKRSHNELKAWIAEQKKSLPRQGEKGESTSALSWETKFDRARAEERVIAPQSEGLQEVLGGPERKQAPAVRFNLEQDEHQFDLETSIGVEQSRDDLKSCESTIDGYSYMRDKADESQHEQVAITPSASSGRGPTSTPPSATVASSSAVRSLCYVASPSDFFQVLEDGAAFEDLIPQSVPLALRKAAEFLEQASLFRCLPLAHLPSERTRRSTGDLLPCHPHAPSNSCRLLHPCAGFVGSSSGRRRVLPGHRLVELEGSQMSRALLARAEVCVT